MFWAVVLVILLLSILFALHASKGARKLVSRPHLLELAAAVRQVKEAALGQFLDQAESAAPIGPQEISRLGKTVVTSQGLSLAYLISRESDDHYGHHILQSYQGGPLPKLAAFTLFTCVRRLLGFEREAYKFEESRGYVLHLQFVDLLTSAEQASFAATAVKVPEASELETFLKEGLTSAAALLTEKSK
jgi:hypothetical protein